MGSNSKRAKEYHEDRISALPDVIRCHILSFMPTRDAVKTSVLSHRWKNAWLSVPNLDLSVCSSQGWSAGFVDRVLFFRGLTNIHKFRLECTRFKNCFSRIDLWINIAIRRNVVELDLDLSDCGRDSDLHVELPSSIFVCKTFRILKLKLGANFIAIAPTSNCFPSLKYLHVTLDRPRLLRWIEKLFA
ncbi:putative F-box domain, leucine-rich repeat domain, L domain-containing protein [Rosa chinensis]|uniref:Putative F-box domain, leucine-rich repeat domain, L domain-containing protein n=1 Tax=Rosa chinensis TaxID=74649 RepID=A0A2P6Q9Y4_ROSCH|nr:putative F-box domain, leucine-rich repeat domain, L domain-containing protein [Rosa chinensis]